MNKFKRSMEARLEKDHFALERWCSHFNSSIAISPVSATIAPTNGRECVNLRSEAVFGTDFAYEDVIPREIEESEYERVADETVSDIPVYVVEVVPKPFTVSDYSRVRVYVEKERFVPLRTRYWDDAGVEVKELRAVPSEIRNFDGVWLPMKATMRNLQQDSFTTLVVSNFVPNPDLPQATFDLSRLEAH